MHGNSTPRKHNALCGLSRWCLCMKLNPHHSQTHHDENTSSQVPANVASRWKDACEQTASTGDDRGPEIGCIRSTSAGEVCIGDMVLMGCKGCCQQCAITHQLYTGGGIQDDAHRCVGVCCTVTMLEQPLSTDMYTPIQPLIQPHTHAGPQQTHTQAPQWLICQSRNTTCKQQQKHNQPTLLQKMPPTPVCHLML